jgi:hypothetical protein
MTPSGMLGGQPVRKAARLLRLPRHGAYAAPITAEVTIREATPGRRPVRADPLMSG